MFNSLYTPNFTSGLTTTSASNVTPFSLLISLTSMSGTANGVTSNSSNALVYAAGKIASIAS